MLEDGEHFLSVRDPVEGDHEFVAAQPAHRVFDTYRVQQPLRDGAQHGITDIVPQGIVDVLESVEVDQHDGDLLPVSLGQLHRHSQTLRKQLAIREPSQRVMVGEKIDPLLVDLLLGNVLDRPDVVRDRAGSAENGIDHEPRRKGLVITAYCAHFPTPGAASECGGPNFVGVVCAPLATQEVFRILAHELR